MMAPLPRILVIDQEYFVAMEAERILADGLACTVEIAMPHDFLTYLEGSAPFDIVVIDAALMTAERQEILQAHQQAGLGVVFTTLSRFAAATEVRKPFVDQELLEAARSALAQSLRTA